MSRPDTVLAILRTTVDYSRGHDYLLPLVYVPTDLVKWQALAPETILPDDDGIVGHGEAIVDSAGVRYQPRKGEVSARAALWGKSTADAVNIFLSVQPDGLLRKYPQAAAADRYKNTAPWYEQ